MDDPCYLNPSKSPIWVLCRIPTTSILQNQPIWVYGRSLLHVHTSILQNQPIWVLWTIPTTCTSILQNQPIWVYAGSLLHVPQSFKINRYEFMDDPYYMYLNPSKSTDMSLWTIPTTCTSILQNQPIWVHGRSLLHVPQSFKINRYEFMQDPCYLNPSKSTDMSSCRIRTISNPLVG